MAAEPTEEEILEAIKSSMAAMKTFTWKAQSTQPDDPTRVACREAYVRFFEGFQYDGVVVKVVSVPEVPAGARPARGWRHRRHQRHGA